MKNNKVLSEVINVWKGHENYLSAVSEGTKNLNISKTMADLFFPGNYYYYVIDPSTLELDLVSNTTEDLLGIKPEDFSLVELAGIIHPDDVNFVLKCEDVIARFLKNHIPVSKIVKYKVSYCLRQKTKRGEYRLFLLQSVTLSVSQGGALLKVFGSHTDISHITTTNNRKLSIIGLDGEPSFLDIDVFDDDPLKNCHLSEASKRFSYRELEIIKLLAQGLKTSEIAERLYISESTVETHRSNILKKSEAKNTIELVVDCLKKGYI